MAIDFTKLQRLPNGGRRIGFEQLICHIAERNRPDNCFGAFHHIHGDGGDGGIEGYWKLDNGQEIGFQAKFHEKPSDINWTKLDGSIQSALKSHPKLIKIIVAMPCDLTDIVPTRKGKSAREKWDEYRIKWQRAATEKNGLNLECEFWGASSIENMLALPINAGLRSYWFGEVELTEAVFKNKLAHSIAALGERYCAADHVEIEVAEVFDGLIRNKDWIGDFPQHIQNLKETSRTPPSPEAKPFLSQWGEAQQVVLEITMRADEFSQSPSIRFDLEWWLEKIRHLNSVRWELVKVIEQAMYEIEDKNQLEDVSADSQNFFNCIDATVNFVNDRKFTADNSRFVFFEGKAGVGKSHLIAERVEREVNDGNPAFLLLGSHFRDTNDIFSQILTQLDLQCSFSEFLDTLNANAEAKKTRAIFAIDAINESNCPKFWRDSLSRLRVEFERRQNLALVISCRSEYTEFCIPDNIKSQSVNIWLEGFQTQEEQEEAAEIYMDRRGIIRPPVPWLSGEFSNPLFLKSVCNALRDNGETQFPTGLRGISGMLKLYLDTTAKNIGSIYYDQSDRLSKPILNYVREISATMARNKRDFVTIDENNEVADRLFFQFNIDKTWSELLEHGGLIRRDPDPLWNDDDPLRPPEDVFRLSYQRFQDYLIARELLDRNTLLASDFENGGDLSFIFAENWISYEWVGVLNALWTIAVEKFGVELCDLIPKNMRNGYPIDEAFIESLHWREQSAFTDRTLEIFRRFRSDSTQIELLLNFVVQDHPWNIDFLHDKLKSVRLAIRDAFWTRSINSLSDYERSSPMRFITWSFSNSFQIVDDNIALRNLQILAWMFSSTNTNLRDHATKAATHILLQRPQLGKTYIELFADVDDPYVVERVFASLAGACLRQPLASWLKVYADTILEIFPNQNEAPIHILTRDYISCIFELAFMHTNESRYEDAFQFSSEAPALDLPVKRVQTLAEKLGARSILSSCNTDTHHYGDFGRYTLKSRVRNFTNVCLSLSPPEKPNYSVRGQYTLPSKAIETWVVHRVLSLGWTDKLFPRDASLDGNRMQGAKIERIGKKYQWTAYYELLARLADNYWLQDDFSEEYARKYTKITDIDFIRNIELTLPPMIETDEYGSSFGSAPSRLEISKVPFSTHQEWVFEEGLAEKRMLETFQNESMYAGYKYVSEKIDHLHKHPIQRFDTYQEEFFFIWMIAVEKDKFASFVERAETKRVDFHRWLPHEYTDSGYVYELGQRNTWSDSGVREEYDGYPNQEQFNFRDLSASYLWEHHLDKTLPDGVSAHLPSLWLIKQLGIQHSPRNLGEFIDANDKVIAQARKVPKSELLEFDRVKVAELLDAHNLEPIWLGVGERSIYPENDSRGVCRTRWNSVLWLEKGKPETRVWLEIHSLS